MATLNASARDARATDGGDAGAPRPVAVWPAGPLEVVAAFDRPIEAAVARRMVGKTIPYGRMNAPAAGGSKPDGALRIVAARLTDENRTMILATDPHPRVARYILPIGEGFAYDLNGVDAAWTEGDEPAATPTWSGWWPSLDLGTTRKLTRGARPQEIGLAHLARTGQLLLGTWMRLPAGQITVRLESTGAFGDVTLGDAVGTTSERQAAGGLNRVEMEVNSTGEPQFLSAIVRTGGSNQPFALKATFRTAGDAADRPIEPAALVLPWAPISTGPATAPPVVVPGLAGGDPARGRAIFRGEQARCGQCHAFRGEGGQVGPDLTGIAEKGAADIYRSIAAPSADIAPDYTTYTVSTRDGQVFAGVVRAEGPDAIKVTDTNARSTIVKRDQIQEIRPSATSIMPPGLAAALGDPAVRDIIAYLTSPPDTKPGQQRPDRPR
ncbi:MAG: hypothetical protein ACYC61_04805 [Isosphaeraceae bacterium]